MAGSRALIPCCRTSVASLHLCLHLRAAKSANRNRIIGPARHSSRSDPARTLRRRTPELSHADGSFACGCRLDPEWCRLRLKWVADRYRRDAHMTREERKEESRAFYRALGERLRVARKTLGISESEAADAAG